MSLEEFVNTDNLRWRDQKRGSIIKKIIKMEEDVVFAISPISYIENFKTSIISDDNLLIELYDTPENIFSRLIFRGLYLVMKMTRSILMIITKMRIKIII